MHEHDGIEPMLADLPVREPSRVLDERVMATLDKARRDAAPPRPNRWLLARAGAIAAVLLIGAAITIALLISNQAPDDIDKFASDGANPPMPRDTTAPERADDAGFRFDPEPIDLRWSRDLGEQRRTAPNGRPYRAVVREVVDQRTWYDPDTGATMQVSTPRQELVIRHQPAF